MSNMQIHLGKNEGILQEREVDEVFVMKDVIGRIGAGFLLVFLLFLFPF